jgi:hypothetical protein
MNRLMNKKIFVPLISGTLCAYAIHNYIKSEKFQEQRLIRECQLWTTKIARFNNQIEKKFGPDLTTKVNYEKFESFEPECKSFSVNIIFKLQSNISTNT